MLMFLLNLPCVGETAQKRESSLYTQMLVKDLVFLLQFFWRRVIDDSPGRNHVHKVGHVHGKPEILLHKENGMSLFVYCASFCRSE